MLAICSIFSSDDQIKPQTVYGADNIRQCFFVCFTYELIISSWVGVSLKCKQQLIIAIRESAVSNNNFAFITGGGGKKPVAPKCNVKLGTRIP